MFSLDTALLVIASLTFLAAGLVKGLIGLGLPAVSLALLTAMISAAARSIEHKGPGLALPHPALYAHPMARPLRIEFPGALYHVTARGNAGKAIYLDDADRRAFLGLLDTVRERFNGMGHA